MPHWTDIGFYGRLCGAIVFFLLLQAGAVPALAANPSEKSKPAVVNTFFDDFSLNQNVRKYQFKKLHIKLRGKSVKARLHPRTVSITILGPALDPAKKAA